MYMRYNRVHNNNEYRYSFIEECSLFGCNEGFIPWLMKMQASPSQGEPYPWHIALPNALEGQSDEGVDYSGSTLIIDLKPSQNRERLSLYEILDVWGYSDSGWTPILMRLRGLFVDEDAEQINRHEFVMGKDDWDEPIYEFMYLTGTVRDGELAGTWNAPPRSPTNAALLWPDALSFFIGCIRETTPQIFPALEATAKR